MNDVLIAWVFVNGIALLALVLMLADGIHIEDIYLGNPSRVYNKIEVNWFGAWFIAIAVNILFPALTIPYWIYKIFTVGRK